MTFQKSAGMPSLWRVAFHLFRFLLILSFLYPFMPGFSKAAQISDISGKVEIQRGGTGNWQRMEAAGAVQTGDSVKTGWRGKLRMYLDDGSRVELGPSSSFSLDADGAGNTDTAVKLTVGRMKAWVQKLAKRKFNVRTPTAVCSVRGTEFEVGVEGGKTSVDLLTGLLAVGDNKGNEALLKDGQHVSVDENGIGRVQSLDDARSGRREEDQGRLRNEVSLNMTKEQVMAAASEEMKLSEYQQGKSMIDVFGKRVRLEQYIMRPRSDQFKLVVLNDRQDRFDYFFYKGTFNTTLPSDLSVALGQLGGCAGAACTYFMTNYETGRSNLTDTVQELAAGGHMVDVNNNAAQNNYTDDDVSSYFDSALNRYVAVSGSYYKTLFDNYSIKYNGIAFNTWEPKAGTGILSYSNSLAGGINYKYIGDNGSLGAVNTGLPATNADRSPDGEVLHDKIKLAYGTGTYWERYDNYIVSDEGKVASLSDFGGDRTGTSYKETLLKWNFEQVVTCSLFGGRKIDLVIEPKTLIQSGLIR